MKAAPKLTASVLHPGNCKQSVPVALVIFHPSTSAAIKNYFPERDDAATFLTLIYTSWTIPNSNRDIITVTELGTLPYLITKNLNFSRVFADWIEEIDLMKFKNAEKFTLSAQTSFAPRRTLAMLGWSKISWQSALL